MDIRRIRVDEAAVVCDLVRQGVEELSREHPEDNVGISETGLRNFETAFRLSAVHDDETTFVATDGNRIVGFITGWLVRRAALPGVVGELDWLWVEPSARETGIERQLGEAAIGWLRERGAKTILVLEDARHPEREPWESLGFEADVIRYSLYG